MSEWTIATRADREAREIADRHYTRQSPGAVQFVPPGRCLVLKRPGALWVTSWPFAEYVGHAWPGAWVCSAFRRESGPVASELIRSALAATDWEWPAPMVPSAAGPIAMITFVDRSKVRRKRDPGRCFLRAGFVVVGETRGGLVALGLPVDAVPPPVAALGVTLRLEEQSA